jgi:hypothetical protein
MSINFRKFGSRKSAGTVAALASLFVSAQIGAQAATISDPSVAGFSIIGSWSNPVLVGSVLDAVTSVPTFYNDASSAVYDTGAAGSSTTVRWGAYPASDNPPVGTIPASSVTFTGTNAIPPSKATAPFSIGSLSYTNGSSVTGTGIFGATLNLYAVGNSTTVPLGSINFQFTATSNDGTDAQNADYLNVSGIPGSFNVYEGATATGAINGTIVGDPMFVPLFFSIDLNQDANGFLGNSIAAPVPEATSWAMMMLGFAGLGFMAYRRDH